MNGVKIEFDKAKCMARVKAASEKAQETISKVALADCNEFVREDQGTLKQSSYAASDHKKGNLVWNTPYAKRVYYTGTVSKAVNSQAALRWAHKAAQKYQKDWGKAGDKAMQEAL